VERDRCIVMWSRGVVKWIDGSTQKKKVAFSMFVFMN
jgi:hypothetical protein